MQHQVPQFIDVEDKIFGPLTAKQFFYILGGGAIIFIMYVFLQFWLVVILGAPVAAFFLSLAFLKINGIPFIKVVSNALRYSSSTRLYLWKKSLKQPKKVVEAPAPPVATPKLTASKLEDLSWSLDIQQKIKR